MEKTTYGFSALVFKRENLNSFKGAACWVYSYWKIRVRLALGWPCRRLAAGKVLVWVTSLAFSEVKKKLALGRGFDSLLCCWQCRDSPQLDQDVRKLLTVHGQYQISNPNISAVLLILKILGDGVLKLSLFLL